MEIEEKLTLRDSQKEAGMVLTQNVKKHEQSGCTVLPLPWGDASWYYLGVKVGSPRQQFDILGCSFIFKKYELIKEKGRVHEKVPVRHTMELTENQVEALNLAAQKRKVEGFDHEAKKRIRGRAADYIILEKIPNNQEMDLRVKSQREMISIQKDEISELKKEIKRLLPTAKGK